MGMTIRTEPKQVFAESAVYFDPLSGPNSSLYLALPPEASSVVENIVEGMRARGIWSEQSPALVEEQKKAIYLQQMRFDDMVRFGGNEDKFVFSAICADHPAYRFNPQRWSDWKVYLLSHYPKFLS